MSTKAKYYFQITTSSGVPIYRQIIDQIKIHIATGRLTKGEFVPSVRQIAQELEVNPMTVSKAYSILEKEGVLEFVRGQGMRVGESNLPKQNLKKKEEELIPLLKQAVLKGRQLSLDQKRFLELIESLWKESQDE